MTAPDVRTPRVPAEANAEDQSTERLHSAAAAQLAQSAADAKRQATLQATAALQGISLHRLASGAWLASRWNLSCELRDDEIAAWLARTGGR